MLKRVGPIVALHGTFARRTDIAVKRVRSMRRSAREPSQIRTYLDAHRIRKLQVGTGPNPLPGWLNTDLFPDTYPEHRDKIFFLDATKPFPLDGMTFDYIFAEHQIEHVVETEARAMLRECFRVLRPGGRIRIATPDLAAILGLYEDPLDERERHYIDWVMTKFLPKIRSGNPRCYVINQMFTAHKHRFIYDHETLMAILTDVGFVEVVRWKAGESDDPVLRGVEAHGSAIGDETVNQFETLVLEAIRPPLASDQQSAS